MSSNAWKIFCRKLFRGEIINVADAVDEARQGFHYYGIYPESIHLRDGCYLFMVKTDKYTKKLVLLNTDNWGGYNAFQGEEIANEEVKFKLAPLNHENACTLRRWWPFTAPVSCGSRDVSLGLGDRLGIASPGHLRIIKKTHIRPVLAQQSVRELNLTGRNFREVIDAATWAVFQENYQQGFGADGDHLKRKEEIREALDAGVTMITLDCSEWIDNSILAATDYEVKGALQKLPHNKQKELENLYLCRKFMIGEHEITFDTANLHKIILVYGKALDFIKEVYHEIIVAGKRDMDFEVSIDETTTSTSPEAHFFVAAELKRAGVEVTSLAPRFCGEFQKGIDYVGDVIQFEKELKVHAAIADRFGYKLSIHSGSDKFKVFPLIGSCTRSNLHLKTAGTSWLEALKVIARYSPGLFREIYKYAQAHLEEARQYYIITIDSGKIVPVDNCKDEELEGLLGNNDIRQMLHITYGIILSTRNESGKFLFRDGIYKILHEREEEYYQALETHIGRHIAALCGSLPPV
ncbi:MAG: tagaturonate epimerase family protein [Firmicutes bacterium]|nr:tagaturonate epimerase family protein [Bacillota bacterium]